MPALTYPTVVLCFGAIQVEIEARLSIPFFAGEFVVLGAGVGDDALAAEGIEVGIVAGNQRAATTGDVEDGTEQKSILPSLKLRAESRGSEGHPIPAVLAIVEGTLGGGGVRAVL